MTNNNVQINVNININSIAELERLRTEYPYLFNGLIEQQKKFSVVAAPDNYFCMFIRQFYKRIDLKLYSKLSGFTMKQIEEHMAYLKDHTNKDIPPIKRLAIAICMTHLKVEHKHFFDKITLYYKLMKFLPRSLDELNNQIQDSTVTPIENVMLYSGVDVRKLEEDRRLFIERNKCLIETNESPTIDQFVAIKVLVERIFTQQYVQYITNIKFTALEPPIYLPQDFYLEEHMINAQHLVTYEQYVQKFAEMKGRLAKLDDKVHYTKPEHTQYLTNYAGVFAALVWYHCMIVGVAYD